MPNEFYKIMFLDMNMIEEIKKINWKMIDENVSIASFSSFKHYSIESSGQIYLKRIQSPKQNSSNMMTVFLLHDLGQYHGRFQSMINWFCKQELNISFILMDFVGHGLSSGRRGHFDKFDQLVNDFKNLLINLEDQKNQDEKWFVLGHGIGGLVALDFQNRFQDLFTSKFDGMILSNFMSKFSSNLLHIDSKISHSILSKILSHTRLTRLLKGEDVLTDAQAILLYEQDPLIIRNPTLNSMREVQLKLRDVYQDSYFLKTPILLLQSTKESSTMGQNQDYFAKGIKKELLREKKYSHMKHDLYNERDKEYVFNDILDWMKGNEV